MSTESRYRELSTEKNEMQESAEGDGLWKPKCDF